VKLLILAGQRRGEVAGWMQDGTIVLPPSPTKMGANIASRSARLRNQLFQQRDVRFRLPVMLAQYPPEESQVIHSTDGQKQKLAPDKSSGVSNWPGCTFADNRDHGGADVDARRCEPVRLCQAAYGRLFSSHIAQHVETEQSDREEAE
jgi:hypothetical protein